MGSAPARTVLKSQRELDVIKGKASVGAATAAEVQSFSDYYSALQGLIAEARDRAPESIEEWCEFTGVPAEQLETNVGIEQGELYFDQVAAIERVLDEADLEDFFGTEGWRHYIGTED